MCRFLIAAFCFLVVSGFCRCSKKKYEKVKAAATQETLSDYLVFQDSVVLRPNGLDAPQAFAVDNQGRFILCDYDAKKVQLLDRNGQFIKNLLGDSTTPAIGNPLSIAVEDSLGDIYVADNGYHLIYRLDSSGKMIHRFMVPATSRTPTHMLTFGNRLVLSGYDVRNRMYLHAYDTTRFHLQHSFMEDAGLLDNPYANGSMNRVFPAKLSNRIYTIEQMNYLVTVFNDRFSQVKRVQAEADYFVPLTAELLGKIKTGFRDIRDAFTQPVFMAAYEGRLYVFTELPRELLADGTPAGRKQYCMDVFDTVFSRNVSQIPMGNMQPVYWAAAQNRLYFLTRRSRTAGTITLKAYAIKNRRVQ